MSPNDIAVGVSIVAVVLQGVNGYLYLRIQNAILKSETKTEHWVDDEFVRKETCQAIHHGPSAARATK
jgi:hypothetical protein